MNKNINGFEGLYYIFVDIFYRDLMKKCMKVVLPFLIWKIKSIVLNEWPSCSLIFQIPLICYFIIVF